MVFNIIFAFRKFVDRTIGDIHKWRERQSWLVPFILVVLHQLVLHQRFFVGEITSTSKAVHHFISDFSNLFGFCQLQSDWFDELVGTAGFDTVRYFRHHFITCCKSESKFEIRMNLISSLKAAGESSREKFL